MRAPETNVSDHGDQINEYNFINSIPSYEKLKLIRKPEVLAMKCISKSTLHLNINNGLDAPSISIGDRAVAFIEHEVLAVITAQIQGKSKDEIRLLVKALVAQRQHISLGE